MKLLHCFFVRNVPRGVGKRLFHTRAEPFLVTGLRLARFFLPGGKRLLFRLALPFAEKALDEPVQISWRQLAGFVEDFGGSAAHGEIVARIAVELYAAW